GASIERSIRQLSVTVYGRDGVRVCPSSFLEQLVGAAVGQISTPSGEAIKLEAQLLAGEQAPSRVLGIWIGRDQRQRGEVVAGDPGGAVRVKHVNPVPESQHEPVMFPDADPQYGFLGELAAVVARCVEHGLEQRLGQARSALRQWWRWSSETSLCASRSDSARAMSRSASRHERGPSVIRIGNGGRSFTA